MSKPLAIAAVMLASLALAPRVRAEGSAVDAGAGTVLYKEARALMERGRYAEACEKLEAADKLLNTAGMLLSLADCREKNGQLATAYGLFEEAGVLARQKSDEDRDAEAKRRAALLEPRLARVRLDMAAGNRGVGVTVKRDGREIPEAAWDAPIPVDPGQHLFEVSAPGKATWRGQVRIDSVSGTTRVLVPLLAAEASAPAGPGAAFWNGQRIAGVVVGSVGLVGVVVGSVFGAQTFSKNSASMSYCPHAPTMCYAPGVSLRNDAYSAAEVSTVAFIAGGIAVAGGLVTFFTATTTPGSTTPGKATGGLQAFELQPIVGSRSGALLLRGSW